MSKVCTWIKKVSSYDTELSVYRLLHPLEADISPVKFWRLQGLIHGIRMEKLKLGIDISEQETKKIYNAVLEGNVTVVLREGNRSPVIGLANIRNPGYGDEEWERGRPLRLLVDPEGWMLEEDYDTVRDVGLALQGASSGNVRECVKYGRGERENEDSSASHRHKC
ncbi:hypothetical protein ARMGADRAFT_1089696 [Armillaria gallica]|uniref:Uncharacterized protein n=1 Tax=Armillaria gallica TaxID=47427 RepID=A0A2H3CVD2_ARMGA|nr:hypothetical protein ARMGADRAFT_1089696 [Armillaria gallica]